MSEPTLSRMQVRALETLGDGTWRTSFAIHAQLRILGSLMILGLIEGRQGVPPLSEDRIYWRIMPAGITVLNSIGGGKQP